MLNLEVQEEIPPTIVISDGILVKEKIEKYHIDPNWINEILKKKHLSQKDVFIMTTTPQQTYQIIRKEAISVSYTHLDVYKRQIIIYSSNN